MDITCLQYIAWIAVAYIQTKEQRDAMMQDAKRKPNSRVTKLHFGVYH